MKKTWLLILPAGAVRWVSSEVETKIKPETEVVVVAPIRLCNKTIVLLGKEFCNNILFYFMGGSFKGLLISELLLDVLSFPKKKPKKFNKFLP